MHPLSEHEILHAWERGQGQHHVERALTLLAAAYPDMTADELATISIGQRDARLLTLRERTFGPTLNGSTECPQCAERLEVALAVPDIRVEPDRHEKGEVLELVTKDLLLRFRLPDSRDLAAVAGCDDAAAARRLLLQRCLVQASRDGMPVPDHELPEEALARVAARMAECDPQAEVLLDLDCPGCGHRWQIAFDIAPFFWAEISAQARRLLGEVHTLARAYGWREADILSMSRARRQLYLEMVT